MITNAEICDNTLDACRYLRISLQLQFSRTQGDVYDASEQIEKILDELATDPLGKTAHTFLSHSFGPEMATAMLGNRYFQQVWQVNFGNIRFRHLPAWQLERTVPVRFSAGDDLDSDRPL